MSKEVGYTKGPWEWRKGSLPWQSTWHLSPGVLIAECSDGTPGGDEIDRANANLIAAAPDLLEACKGLVSLWSEDYVGNDLDEANAAIAKAEGRS